MFWFKTYDIDWNSISIHFKYKSIGDFKSYMWSKQNELISIFIYLEEKKCNACTHNSQPLQNLYLIIIWFKVHIFFSWWSLANLNIII